MPAKPISNAELSGAVILANQQRELFCRYIAQGMPKREAYTATCGRPITPASAGVGARTWLKRPEVAARINHLSSIGLQAAGVKAPPVPGSAPAAGVPAAASGATSGQGATPSPLQGLTPPDIGTMTGRLAVLGDMVNAYYAGGIKDSDAIAALKELLKIHRDAERQADKSSATDPAAIMAALSRVQCEGVSVFDIAQGAGFSLSEIAERIAAALGVEAVMIRNGADLGAWGDIQPPTPDKLPVPNEVQAHRDSDGRKRPPPADGEGADVQTVDASEAEQGGHPVRANSEMRRGPMCGAVENSICITGGSEAESTSVGVESVVVEKKSSNASRDIGAELEGLV